MDTTSILTRVLDIINYQDSKSQFIDTFSSQCVRLAIMTCIDALPKEKKDELMRKMNGKQEVDAIRSTLAEYVTESEFQEVLKNTAQKQFEDYIETILPTLTTLSSKELIGFLSTIAASQYSH